MTRTFALTLAISVAMVPGIAPAADAAAGEAKAALCNGCHHSDSPMVPTLAGMPEKYLVKATKAYTTGERNDASMKTVLGALSDEDIANLAAYYAGQSCK